VATMKDMARQGQGCGGRTKRRYNQGAVRNNGGKVRRLPTWPTNLIWLYNANPMGLPRQLS
jgi:hypothetical protein